MLKSGWATAAWIYLIQYKYKLDQEDFENLWDKQNGRCAGCDVQFACPTDYDRTEGVKPFVDHDHDTGKVRGLLCTGCNVVLGQNRDRIQWIEYQEKSLGRERVQRLTQYLINTGAYKWQEAVSLTLKTAGRRS